MRGAPIHLQSKLSDGVLRLAYDGDVALWTRCRLRKRGERCQLSGAELEPGTIVYRPIGNQSYRMVRIEAVVLEAIVEKMLADEAS